MSGSSAGGVSLNLLTLFVHFFSFYVKHRASVVATRSHGDVTVWIYRCSTTPVFQILSLFSSNDWTFPLHSVFRLVSGYPPHLGRIYNNREHNTALKLELVLKKIHPPY